jgi:hypothetical protein
MPSEYGKGNFSLLVLFQAGAGNVSFWPSDKCPIEQILRLSQVRLLLCFTSHASWPADGKRLAAFVGQNDVPLYAYLKLLSTKIMQHMAKKKQNKRENFNIFVSFTNYETII